MDSQFPPEYNHDKIKGELIDLLKEGTAVLMVGSGSSSIVNYPGWKQLVIDLKNKFYPSYQDPSPTDNLLDYAQIIKDQAFRHNRKREYYQFLHETFQPSTNHGIRPFHVSLVKLGFSGIITTNYDRTL